ncbi:MAG: tRNA-dihydrouridine synthase family protein, partial [Verrucomicrobia bacterium]|nr:tRNA-dihydrouridine synthase family protein [Verrucomicrobiota bacterium]
MIPAVFSASRPLLVLAPMAGYTNLPFRELIREKAGGLDWTVTELVNARSLMERRDEALKLSKTTDKDSPCFVQLFSGVISETAEAARIVEAQGAAGVDINMGCPAPKVIKSGGGSALLADPEHAIRLVEAVVQSVRIPVTVKMRLGMTPDQIVAPKLAYAFQELGVQAVTIHGRTRSQGFSGNVDLNGIREVVQAAPKIPVLANGDVTTAENALFMLKQTGAAGLSIGRGAFYNPWLFSQIRSALTGKARPPLISFEERLHFMT